MKRTIPLWAGGIINVAALLLTSYNLFQDLWNRFPYLGGWGWVLSLGRLAMVLVLNKREKLPMETTQSNTVSLTISQYSISDLSYCTQKVMSHPSILAWQEVRKTQQLTTTVTAVGKH